MANPRQTAKPRRTLAEELGGAAALVEPDPSRFIKQALEATADKKTDQAKGKPRANPPEENRQEQAPRPAAAPALAPRQVTTSQAAPSNSRPWGTPAPTAQYRPGRRPPGKIGFSFEGRVEDGKRLDSGKYLLRCAGDGWYSIYAEMLPDWVEVGVWLAISGIIAAGQGGTLFLWAREFTAIQPIRE